jgi:hypothetical protein
MIQDASSLAGSDSGVSHGLPPERRQSVFERRARLVVQCALSIPGMKISRWTGDIKVPLSIQEFAQEFQRRFGRSHPGMTYRAASTFERARLDRRQLKDLPRVVLRQGPPPKSQS